MLLHTLRWFIVLSIISGVMYPGVIYLIAKPIQANMQFYSVQEDLLFKYQIGESGYYWLRPINYTEENGKLIFQPTNLAANEPMLVDRISAYVAKVRAVYNKLELPIKLIPAEVVTTSATGNETIITYQNALFQTKRVALERKIPFEILHNILKDQVSHDIEADFLPVTVDVIKLNALLDEQFGKYE